MQKINEKKDSVPRPAEGMATLRTRKRIDPLMRDWYGDSSPSVMMDFLPETQSISDVMGRVSKRLFPSYLMNLQRVKREWASIAGARAASFSEPSFLSEGVLNIEVSHPAYRSALDSSAVKNALLEKIRAITGDAVNELRFIPGGRSRKKS